MSENLFWVTQLAIAVTGALLFALIVGYNSYNAELATAKTIAVCVADKDRIYVRGSCVRADTVIRVDGNLR